MRPDLLAELHLCLARALLPPTSDAQLAALRNALPDDVAELVADLALPVRGVVDELRAALASTPPAAIRQSYAELFYVPPRAVPLNAGVYLERAVSGPFVVHVRRLRSRFGAAEAEDFRDLPDHLSSLLELHAVALAAAAETAGWMREAAAAADVASTCLRPWLPAFRERLAAATLQRNVCPAWLALADVLLASLGLDSRQAADAASGPRAAAQTRPAREWRPRPEDHLVCRVCGSGFVADRDLHAMKRILAKRGADSTRLDNCPACRATVLDLARCPPPELGTRERGRELSGDRRR